MAVPVVQCAPVVAAWERGTDRVESLTSRGTVADGLDFPGAIMGHGIIQAVRDTNRTAVAVAEDALIPWATEAGALELPLGLESAALLAAPDGL